MTSAFNAVQPVLSGEKSPVPSSVSNTFSELTPGRTRPPPRTPPTPAPPPAAAAAAAAVTKQSMTPPVPVDAPADGPDLSHLSAEERRQIEAVLARAAMAIPDADVATPSPVHG
jgi:hypothetical protein